MVKDSIGICGKAGFGKTTLARMVYNIVAPQFEASCFLSDMRKICISHLLDYLVAHISKENHQLASIRDETKFFHRKILIVLVDDVDSPGQFHEIVRRFNPGCFGCDGIKVIITTRDKHLLTSLESDNIYEIQVLTIDETCELIGWNLEGSQI
ncbi:disease resistance protein RUN1-like [Lotus japonicus]|uniref:disease resistance protein RUN1-like n=1 Tax=Lotus japonicus TaxID=34305 RepID=UPI0025895733|nr:disease resistance protein RUN1-like [Lotus japonicus]